jgi:hypothetical protein
MSKRNSGLRLSAAGGSGSASSLGVYDVRNQQREQPAGDDADNGAKHAYSPHMLTRCLLILLYL